MRTRLRRIAESERGAGFPHAYQGQTAGAIPFFKVSDFSSVGNERHLENCTNCISLEDARQLRATIVPRGSILLPKIGAALLGNARRICTRPSAFDNNVMAVVPLNVDVRYLYYFLGTVDMAELANPGPVPSLSDDVVKELSIPSVAQGAQRAIADFLDVETARIDALVEKKRNLIEGLSERRAGIAELGVSGRDSPSDLASSALPWLAARPRHWREAKLTLLARLGTGHTPSRDHPEWWEDPTIPWITTGEVAQMRGDRIEEIFDTREKISKIGVRNSAAELHPAGTVVLSRTASAGYSAIMGTDMATSQDFVTWTCGPLLRPRFLLLCLRAMRQDLLGRLAMGSTHKTIYMPDIESIRVPVPPTEEQDEIVEEVWIRLRPIDRTIDRLECQIGLLAEHRQALITAAVTGDLDVPGAAA